MYKFAQYSKKAIQKLCQDNNIGLKKRWGQNFLYDKPSIDKIVSTIINCTKSKSSLLQHKDILHNNIWEIGPGLGALSTLLMQHSKQLTLFEIDYGIIRILEKYFVQEIKSKKINIIAGDASKTVVSYLQNTSVENDGKTSNKVPDNISDNALENIPKSIPKSIPKNIPKNIPDIICGNLPYSTGTRMIIEICSVPQLRVPMCIMLQKEAINRLAASCGNKQYGISTVFIQSMYTVIPQYGVAKDNFYPYTHVDSFVCTLEPKNAAESFLNASVEDIKLLKNILKIAFSSRRKQIKNTLYPYLRHTYKNSDKVLEELALDGTKRAEQIPVDTYCTLVRFLQH